MNTRRLFLTTAILCLHANVFSVAAAQAQVIPPQCPNPASFFPPQGCYAGFIVEYRAGIEARTTTPGLEQRYGFRAAGLLEFSLFQGFVADLSPSQIAALRCEPTIQSISINGIGGPGGVTTTTCVPRNVPVTSGAVRVLLITAIAFVGIAMLRVH